MNKMIKVRVTKGYSGKKVTQVTCSMPSMFLSSPRIRLLIFQHKAAGAAPVAEVDHKLRGRPIFEAELQGERVVGSWFLREGWRVWSRKSAGRFRDSLNWNCWMNIFFQRPCWAYDLSLCLCVYSVVETKRDIIGSMWVQFFNRSKFTNMILESCRHGKLKSRRFWNCLYRFHLMLLITSNVGFVGSHGNVFSMLNRLWAGECEEFAKCMIWIRVPLPLMGNASDTDAKVMTYAYAVSMLAVLLELFVNVAIVRLKWFKGLATRVLR